jgi:hypothetical protein
MGAAGFRTRGARSRRRSTVTPVDPSRDGNAPNQADGAGHGAAPGSSVRVRSSDVIRAAGVAPTVIATRLPQRR